jgi:hypothetical protein
MRHTRRKLLSQKKETPMRSDTTQGTFEEIVAAAPDDVRAIAERLRSLIDALDPTCVEVPRPGDRAASYGVGPKKMSEAYAYIMPQKGYANLGFYHGAMLPDPEGLLEGTGKRLRHVKVRTLDAVDAPAVAQMLLAARQERIEALGLDG